MHEKFFWKYIDDWISNGSNNQSSLLKTFHEKDKKRSNPIIMKNRKQLAVTCRFETDESTAKADHSFANI